MYPMADEHDELTQESVGYSSQLSYLSPLLFIRDSRSIRVRIIDALSKDFPTDEQKLGYDTDMI